MPAGHDITILKDRFLKNPSKVQFWLHKLLASGVISTKQRKSELSLLDKACLLVLIYASTKYYQNISNHLEVMKCTKIWLSNSFRGVNLKKEQRYCPSCM